jgi:hypothetical protein
MGLAFSQRISERSALGSGKREIEVWPQAGRQPAEPMLERGASGPPSGSIDIRFDDEGDDVDESTLTREYVVGFEPAARHHPRPVAPRALVRREDCTRILSDEHAEWMGATPVLAMPVAEIHALAIARQALEVVPLIDGYSSLSALLGRCSNRPTWQTILAFDELVARGAVVFLLLDESA